MMIFETSPSLAAFAPAFHAAQAQMENAKKDSKNPHFKSDYANLNSVQDAVMPALSANGLSMIQGVGGSPGTNGINAQIVTRILHVSGEWIQCTATAPMLKQDPQAMGSTLTYLRRYSAAGMTGITQTDDDGEAAVRELKPKPAKREIFDLATTIEMIGTVSPEESKAMTLEAVARFKQADEQAAVKQVQDAYRKRFPKKD